ncbi:MAG: hypothetical protein OXF27_02745 [Acidobacteria bacterium]|nr:hypothetical protein [Acidobacteriota bacterium]
MTVKTFRGNFLSLAGCAAFVGLILAAAPAAAAERESDVTFTRDVAPIMQRSCEKCHRPRGGAPMALISYQDVRPWARSIKNRTQSREMPPWFIDKNIGIQHYKDDPSLSDAEIATIAAWVDNGAPRGNPEDLPPPTVWPVDGWTYGTPDLIVPSPEGTVEADAADWFGEWGHTPSGLTEDRYVKAIEVKEVRLHEEQAEVDDDGRAALGLFVVHHAVLTAESPEDTGGPANCGRRTFCGERDNEFTLVHELGQNATVYPDDVGVLLPAGSVITFNSMHLHSIGREVSARLDVGFTLHPKDYEPKYNLGLTSLGRATQYDYEFDIPAEDDNVMRDGFHRLDQPTKMLTFEPHLHSSGKRMCFEALYPNNAREMLSCADYDHNWAKVYVFEDDVAPLLPAGTVVRVMSWYNNSETNKNVVDPRNWKGWGNRSIDDMMSGITRMVHMTQEQFDAEIAARGGSFAFASSQDQQ